MPLWPAAPSLVGVGLLAAVSSPAAAAAAAAVPTGEGTGTDATTLPAPQALRSGMVLGLALGAGLGGASGYPNDINQIGDPSYYSASGWMVGSSYTLFLMGALTDYLNFGVFFSQGNFRNSEWRSTGAAGGVRLETFPLEVLVPQLATRTGLAGLGAMAQFGLGSGKLTATAPALAGAAPTQGTQSFADVGVFYEWAFGRLRHGHFAAGPSVEYEAIWSQPFESHGLVASVRVAFYGGP